MGWRYLRRRRDWLSDGECHVFALRSGKIAMLKPRTIVIGGALVGAVSCSALIWQLNRGPGTFALPRAAADDTPKARLRLISPGILRIALEARNTSPAGLALLGDGTTFVGATIDPIPAAFRRRSFAQTPDPLFFSPQPLGFDLNRAP